MGAEYSSPTAPRTPGAARRRVMALAWPLIVSNLTVPLLGLVDTAVVGHLSDSRYLGGVTLGATLFSFLYWGFGFLRMGTTGLAAQACGRQDQDDLIRLLGQSLMLAAVIGLALIALHPLLIPAGLALLDGSAAVTAEADTYARIRILSAPAVLANYALIGWFLGRGYSRITLVLMIVNNVANILLDLLFVVGLGMTTDGVALASVMADYLALIVGAGWALHAWRGWGWRRVTGVFGPVAGYRRLLGVNAALFIRTLCLLFAFAFFHSQGAQLGDVTLAANAVLLQFVLLASYGLDGFAHATESLVGQQIGADDEAGFRRVVRAALEWSLATAMLASLGFALGGEALIRLLTDLPDVRAMAERFLPWMVAMPLLAVASYLLDGIFIGATRTRAMRDTMVVAVVAGYLPVWWLCQPLGNHGLWLAFVSFTLARGVLLGAVFWRSWRHRTWFAAALDA
ncbi:MATE family efflux transporter [Spiribacter aquaticus]|uniref:MATE family efflux transporter n=1 Tax=Spiribacter aquaticus TaxID=1935996 RepID=A0A557RHL9_9GAMM|nr:MULTISPECIES: MATE family efflux transporter [Spiribacter]KAF0280592.1 MATE family efflux transporter [Spiribacter roseus]TVO64660.1 MATE family efflux transporter [Spiribacter aquaticus]